MAGTRFLPPGEGGGRVSPVMTVTEPAGPALSVVFWNARGFVASGDPRKGSLRERTIAGINKRKHIIRLGSKADVIVINETNTGLEQEPEMSRWALSKGGVAFYAPARITYAEERTRKSWGVRFLVKKKLVERFHVSLDVVIPAAVGFLSFGNKDAKVGTP